MRRVKVVFSGFFLAFFWPINVSAESVLDRLSNLESELESLKADNTKFKEMAAASKMQRDLLTQRMNKLDARVWRNVRSSRRLGSEYTNNRGYPIEVAITAGGGGSGQNSNSCDARILVNNQLVGFSKDNMRDFARLCNVYATIPPNAVYQAEAKSYPTETGRLIVWQELY